MSKFDSARKARFLAQIPTASLENLDCPLTKRCKFNFAYFEKQPASQDFNEWSSADILRLIDKLKEFNRESLLYWMNQSVGKSGTVLAIYGGFPSGSDMTHPKHIPHEVQWGRFRLDWSSRLCGFIVPRSLNGLEHPGTKLSYDANTFYVVFLDKDHKFYKGKESK